MIKRILVALSGTPYARSEVEHAIELARIHGASLTGVTIVDAHRLESVGPVPIGGGADALALAEDRRRRASESMEESIALFERECDEAGLECSVIRETGDPLDELARCWRYHDVTFFGLRGVFDYGVLRAPDDRILDLIARGVGPIIAVAERPRRIRRVLVAYNGSMESAKAMKAFAQMRLWPDVASVKVACFHLDEAEAAPLLAHAGSYLRAYGYDVETDLVAASPVHPTMGVVEHAREWSADLVVLGATGHHNIIKRLLGRTVLHAMQQSDMPLFLSR